MATHHKSIDDNSDHFYINRAQVASDIKTLAPDDFNKTNPSLTRETGVLNNVYNVAKQISDKSKQALFISVSTNIISKAIDQNKPIFFSQVALLSFKKNQDAVQTPRSTMNPKH